MKVLSSDTRIALSAWVAQQSPKSLDNIASVEIQGQRFSNLHAMRDLYLKLEAQPIVDESMAPENHAKKGQRVKARLKNFAPIQWTRQKLTSIAEKWKGSKIKAWLTKVSAPLTQNNRALEYLNALDLEEVSHKLPLTVTQRSGEVSRHTLQVVNLHTTPKLRNISRSIDIVNALIPTPILSVGAFMLTAVGYWIASGAALTSGKIPLAKALGKLGGRQILHAAGGCVMLASVTMAPFMAQNARQSVAWMTSTEKKMTRYLAEAKDVQSMAENPQSRAQQDLIKAHAKKLKVGLGGTVQEPGPTQSPKVLDSPQAP